MKKINLFLFAFSLLLLTVACNHNGLKKTDSGLMYKIISDGKGQLVKRGEFLKINFTQRRDRGDSVLFSSTDATPAYIRVDSVGANYSPLEIFTLLRKGDSAMIVQMADSLTHKSMQPLPPFLHLKDKIVLTMRVVNIFETEKQLDSDRALAVQGFRVKQSKEVEDYLAANKIKFQKAPRGTYVKIDSVGDGPAVDTGKEVSVLYTGKLFPSGKVFESNMEGAGKEPIKFVVGKSRIIPGWEDGLRLFKKGGRGTLYIPSFLAYDNRPGPGKTPYESLIFDVRIVDVTDAPPPTAPTPAALPVTDPRRLAMPDTPSHK